MKHGDQPTAASRFEHGEETMPGVESYDAVIVGASFGGLAAASQLQGAGRILVADRQPVGVGETSASGTLLAVLERLDALDALEQVLPSIALNVAGRRIRFQPVHPFATFDYRIFCEILADRLAGVEIAVAAFSGVEPGGVIRLGDRRVRGRVMIDASGWRALLARAYGAPPPDRSRGSVGAELRHGHGGDDLEFWIRPEGRPDGVFWAFPAGGHTREGVASYLGRGRALRSDLSRLVQEETLPSHSVHGGIFPSRLRDPVTGPVFVVGDAAGQCLPLSGEGIRPALVWGQEAGRQAVRVLRDEVSLDRALGVYRDQVLARRRQYRTLERLQAALLRAPLSLLPAGVKAFTGGPLSRAAQTSYWLVANPDMLQVAPGVMSSARVDAARTSVGPAAGQPLHEATVAGSAHGVSPWAGPIATEG